MTANRRVLLNFIATCGRSMYTLAVGLFCGRWTLMALGEVDYGLMGLIGGLIGFVGFINALFSSAVTRFYAVEVGAALKDKDAKRGLENCQIWFTTAFVLYMVVPTVLLVIGYPIGAWAVDSFLSIPTERLIACKWVWRFTCISCFIGMCNIPFGAMYNAKQEIAELTIYSFVTTTLNALFLYYMVSHPGVWLTRYTLFTCLLGIVPQLFIIYRAVIKYPECRLRWEPTLFWRRIRQLTIYAFARFWSECAGMIESQGRSILVNKFIGPIGNTSVAIGNTVACHASTLAASLSTAFWPVVANKAGEKDWAAVRNLSFMVCRLGAIMLLVMALPASIEATAVLRLWLGRVPLHADAICVSAMMSGVLIRLGEGYWMAILGQGIGVVRYSMAMGWAGFVGCIVMGVMFAFGFGFSGVCLGIIVGSAAILLVRLYYGRVLVMMSVRCWIVSVAMPIVAVSLIAGTCGYLLRLVMCEGFLRIVCSTCIVEIVFLPLTFIFVLNENEKQYILERFGKLKILKNHER